VPAEGSLFKNIVAAFRKRVVVGRPALTESGIANVNPPDSCDFEVVTGSSALADITIGTSAPTTVLLSDSLVPYGLKCYVTAVQVYASTASSGATNGTDVVLTLEDTTGTDIVTFTQAALSSGAFLAVPASSPGTGVTDSVVKTLGASALTAGRGIQATLSNATAGVFRIRIAGYFAT